MLDDERYINSIDRGNALGIVAGQPAQLRQAYEVEPPKPDKIKQIVVAGMGGSALAAEFVRNWLGDRLPIPLVIVRDYNLPAFVGPETLVIASSYSGDTEETLSALAAAKSAKAEIVVTCSGGKLKELAEKAHYTCYLLPGGLEPRYAVLYGVAAIAQLLETSGVINGLGQELKLASEWVQAQIGNWTAEVQTDHNEAKQIANKLFGSGVVVYAGPTLAMPGLRWKINFNENSKNLAFFCQWPEFDHNEILGWFNPPQKQLKVVELVSSLDHPEIKRRYVITNRLLSGKMPSPITVQAEGQTKLTQMLWSLVLGDFVSMYLAILNGVDPLQIDIIEKLKKELA